MHRSSRRCSGRHRTARRRAEGQADAGCHRRTWRRWCGSPRSDRHVPRTTSRRDDLERGSGRRASVATESRPLLQPPATPRGGVIPFVTRAQVAEVGQRAAHAFLGVGCRYVTSWNGRHPGVEQPSAEARDVAGHSIERHAELVGDVLADVGERRDAVKAGPHEGAARV